MQLAAGQLRSGREFHPDMRSTGMYEEYFGLTEKPFSILPDPDFLFWTQGHTMAYSMLEYGILNQAGFTVITGDIGCGKTTLVRELLRHLDERVTVGLVSNIMPGSGKLLEWVMMSLNQPLEGKSYVELYRQFQDLLVAEYGQGRHVVLILDEAQNLGVDELEELRMLSNINADKHQLLQLVLVGQPQLRELLQHPSLTQFAQRVSSDFHLYPLNPDEVADYIHHRMIKAGAKKSLFSPVAIEMIAHESHGIPRTINILCDTALVYAFSQGAPAVHKRMVAQVIDDKRQYGALAQRPTPKEALRLPDRGK
jgi:general secretion pathway protein A